MVDKWRWAQRREGEGISQRERREERQQGKETRMKRAARPALFSLALLGFSLSLARLLPSSIYSHISIYSKKGGNPTYNTHIPPTIATPITPRSFLP